MESSLNQIVVGVDGGGSKTRVLVADAKGTEIGSLDAGPSAIQPGEIERSADVIAGAIRQALVEAEVDAMPAVAVIGVAGGGRPSERDALWQALVARDVADEVVVHADATIALEDAFGEGPGVLLIAGTGSMALGRGPTGVLARCGGWGPVFGDEGSGVWLSRRALGIVGAAADGREAETALTGAILTAAVVDSVEALIPWAASATAADLAALAPAVIHCADSGDARAETLVAFAIEELVLHVRALARHLFTDERAATPVAVVGGLLLRGSFRSRFERRLTTAVPGALLKAGEVVPARGAVRHSLRYLTAVLPTGENG
ncbi:MAG TPA: BadF/BadG/BcrA/BcrD ATPase family protein [Gemmatimonadaceae bacterium]|nr:BadF/BadG/BcrA/BcrD ATPase family protein [Gemmatimonadaceae bacterium]